MFMFTRRRFLVAVAIFVRSLVGGGGGGGWGGRKWMAVTEGKRERGKKEERRRREGWTDRWRRGREGGTESRGME